MHHNGVTRRSFLRASAATLPLSLGVAATGTRRAFAQESKGPINFLTWGGTFGNGVRVAFSDPFQKETGIEIRDITPFNFGKFYTAMKNGNPEQYDLVWFNDEVEAAQLGEEGMLEEIRYDGIPNLPDIVPAARQKYGAAPHIAIYLLCYNTSTLQGKKPEGWKDFWDVENFPGPRSLGNWVSGVLEAALMADGVQPANLYPLDEDRAFRMLDKIKPSIRVFHDTQASQSVDQMLQQGDVAMVMTWAEDTITARESGRPVDVVFDQGFYFSPLVGIAKGTKYLDECTSYIARFYDPKAEAVFVNAWPTSPVNPASLDLLTPAQRNATVTAHLKSMVNFNAEYYLKNRARLQQKYDSWRLA